MTRAKNLQTLKELGFTVSPGLPTQRDAVTGLRPAEEIMRRLCGLDAVCSWVMSTQEDNPDELIVAYIDDNDLDLDGDDVEILQTPRARAQQQFIDSIGWRLENMWPLAWVLGFPRLPTVQGMIDDGVIQPLFRFLPKMTDDLDAWTARQKVRAAADVVDLEDFFYCAHNAARSAQLAPKGKATTVPRGFDAVVGAGVIHERRHALTWAVSPDVRWEETDLST